MTEQEKMFRAQMTASIVKELARTNPTVKVTSKYPVRKKDSHGEVYETLWGKENGRTVLIVQKKDCSLKITDEVENYKNVK